jgi:hypothetical protein
MNTPSASTVEGRARAARPSACLPPLLTALLLAAILPGSALALQPKSPLLTGTNPDSPSAELRPYVFGNPDGGVITSAFPRAAALGPATRDAEHPTFTITIYAEDGTCTDAAAIVGVGTSEELEETGIRVEEDVTAGAETIFFARQTDPSDPGNPSDCSKGLAYRHVDGPPAAPSLTATDPSSPADDNFPNLIGIADAETTVAIYTNDECAGAQVASGKESTFEKQGIEVAVSDNTTTTFWAQSTIAGFSSPCSTSSISYQEVSVGNQLPEEEDPGGGGGGNDPDPSGPDPKGRPSPPELRTVPGYSANDNTPRVTGKAPGSVRVQVFGSAGCKGPVLAEGATAELTGPGFEIRVADDTVVTFYGVSIDAGKDRSQCAQVPAVFIEDSTAPHTRITSGPAAKTRKRKVVFRFADISGDTAVKFSCKVDRKRWKSCRAPLKLKKLSRKRHVLKVKAVDAAGNVEKRVAKRRFRVVRSY